WMQLEGVGPSLASRIVADREVHGPFATIDDLQRVPGIGPATLDRIRASLRIRHEHQTADRRLP
ncbi:MAG: ComEA family DNA-binding protein, partial [Planctomyces sp.]